MDIENLADMAISSLKAGKKRKSHAHFARDLSAEDLARAPSRPPNRNNTLQRIRSTHHFAAKLLAEGQRPIDVAAATGYAPAHISVLQADPAFKELVAHYKEQVQAKYLNVHEKLAFLGIASMEELMQRLEENPDSFSHGELLEQLKATLDRAGFGPTSRQVTENRSTVTVELLERVKQEVANRGQVRKMEEIIDVPLIAAE